MGLATMNVPGDKQWSVLLSPGCLQNADCILTLCPSRKDKYGEHFAARKKEGSWLIKASVAVLTANLLLANEIKAPDYSASCLWRGQRSQLKCQLLS